MTPIADKLAAARGQAKIAPEAGLELVVALARDPDEQVRAEARRTLAAWPAETLQPLLRRSSASAQTLEYFLNLENLKGFFNNSHWVYKLQTFIVSVTGRVPMIVCCKARRAKQGDMEIYRLCVQCTIKNRGFRAIKNHGWYRRQ